MVITVEDVKKARDSVKVGDYVLESKQISPENSEKIFMVSKVVLKSKYVFVTSIVGTNFPGIRTSYRYAELLVPGDIRVVTESEALQAARILAGSRKVFLASA